MATATINVGTRFVLPQNVSRIAYGGLWSDKKDGVFLGIISLPATGGLSAGDVIEYDAGALQLNMTDGRLTPMMATGALDGGLFLALRTYVSLHTDWPESVGSSEIPNLERFALPRHHEGAWTLAIDIWPFGPPTGLTATAVGQDRINLAWLAPSDLGGHIIDGYKLERSADGITFTDLVADTGTLIASSLTYSHTGLGAGTTMYYRVSALDVEVVSLVSLVTSATTDT